MANDAHAHGRAGSLRRHPTAKLDQYLEDKLTAEQSQRIGAHLHNCPSCLEEAQRRSQVLRLARQQQPSSILATSDVRGVQGWKVVLGILTLGAVGCVLLLTAWILGGDQPTEEPAVAGEDSPAAALLGEFQNQLVPEQNLVYEDILAIRNVGFACPLLTGLGYSYTNAQILHDDPDVVSVRMELTRGDQHATIVESRELSEHPATGELGLSAIKPAQNKSGVQRNTLQVVDEPVAKDTPEDSFKVRVTMNEATYLIEGSGTPQQKEQIVNYVALSEQARLTSGDTYPQQGVRDRFERGFSRLIGQ